MLGDLHQLTAGLYLASSVLAFLGLAWPTQRQERLTMVLLGLGLAAHTVAFATLHAAAQPPPLTELPAAMSLMAWVAVFFCLFLLRRRRLVGLVALVAPLAFLAVFYAGLVLPHSVGVPAASGSWPHLHIILASAGLGLLGVAGLAGLLFLAAERRLKAKRPSGWGLRLPSLEALDRVNGVALAIGFPLLTCGVVAGMLWSRETTGHLWAGGGARDLERGGLGDLCRVGRRSLRRGLARAGSGRERRDWLRLPLVHCDRCGARLVKLLLVGMSHRTAPLAVRECFAIEDPTPALSKLVGGEEIEEAVLLSTCNRVETVVLTRQLEAARHRLRAFFRRDLGGEPALPPGITYDKILYEHVGTRAIHHMFRVASSLDSMVVGEPQILGQTKDAYRAAVDCEACGIILNRLFHRAFATAKRVRTETRVAEGALSVARVAVDLARQIFEALEDKTALLVGAGDMIELALESLCNDGLGAVRVANRSAARAGSLAARFRATAHGLDEIERLLEQADMVLTSISGERPLLTTEHFARALRARQRRPIFVIDIGVPRNVSPDVNRLDGVFLYDLDDLSGIAQANAEARRRETTRAEAIVQAEVERFDGWLSALQAVPTIRHLRTRAEAIRSHEMERAAARLRLDAEQLRGVDALTQAIVNKLLHAPVSRLRREAEREEGIAYLEAARALFALDQSDGRGAATDPERYESEEE